VSPPKCLRSVLTRRPLLFVSSLVCPPPTRRLPHKGLLAGHRRPASPEAALPPRTSPPSAASTPLPHADTGSTPEPPDRRTRIRVDAAARSDEEHPDASAAADDLSKRVQALESEWHPAPGIARAVSAVLEEEAALPLAALQRRYGVVRDDRTGRLLPAAGGEEADEEEEEGSSSGDAMETETPAEAKERSMDVHTAPATPTGMLKPPAAVAPTAAVASQPAASPSGESKRSGFGAFLSGLTAFLASPRGPAAPAPTPAAPAALPLAGDSATRASLARGPAQVKVSTPAVAPEWPLAATTQAPAPPADVPPTAPSPLTQTPQTALGPGAPGPEGGAPLGAAPASAVPTDRDLITAASCRARLAQPTGHTLASSHVLTPVPSLLRGTLREYQRIGLDWLATLYAQRLNGILADEMGLGKTVMTIALLAHLIDQHHVWGPHLIVVPTSVIVNWEIELRRWCPALKILAYYGSPRERKAKRADWSRPNTFHVCVTSYQLVLQDAIVFRRKRWHCLILDEAQNIKNFRSQRWQVLLNFHSQFRLLLTGTPLQNSLMELWSLMHFLMPTVFRSNKVCSTADLVPLRASPRSRWDWHRPFLDETPATRLDQWVDATREGGRGWGVGGVGTATPSHPWHALRHGCCVVASPSLRTRLLLSHRRSSVSGSGRPWRQWSRAVTGSTAT